jgi:hypothetical protein
MTPEQRELARHALGLPETTPLYASVMAFNSSASEHDAFMRELWTRTPWMIDVKTGNINSDSWREIFDWLRKTFGKEGSIWADDAEWRSGNATIFGWTWIGFKTKAQMEQFITRVGALDPGESLDPENFS